MFTSKTPVVTSGDVNARVAFHWSNVPCIATDAFTLNAIELSACVIAKTGASCAWLIDGSRTDANRQRAINRMQASVMFPGFTINYHINYCSWPTTTRHLRILETDRIRGAAPARRSRAGSCPRLVAQEDIS